jgi:hypothetical protein
MRSASDMTNETLKAHYERKYSREGFTSSIESIRKVHSPTSRFEAVVKFFPKYFKGGAILELVLCQVYFDGIYNQTLPMGKGIRKVWLWQRNTLYG